MRQTIRKLSSDFFVICSGYKKREKKQLLITKQSSQCTVENLKCDRCRAIDKEKRYRTDLQLILWWYHYHISCHICAWYLSVECCYIFRFQLCFDENDTEFDYSFLLLINGNVKVVVISLLTKVVTRLILWRQLFLRYWDSGFYSLPEMILRITAVPDGRSFFFKIMSSYQ